MTSPTTPRQSALDRLARLDRVFSVEDFERGQGLSAKAASVYLARWQAQGLIGRLGRRCGLWVNLRKDAEPAITWSDRVSGLLRKHPQAIVGGHSALAAHGWLESKQGQATTVLVPQGFSKAQLDGFDLQARSPRAHALLKGMARAHPRLGLPTLPGEAAVADLVAQGQDVPRALRQQAGDVGGLVQALGGQNPGSG